MADELGNAFRKRLALRSDRSISYSVPSIAKRTVWVASEPSNVVLEFRHDPGGHGASIFSRISDGCCKRNADAPQPLAAPYRPARGQLRPGPCLPRMARQGPGFIQSKSDGGEIVLCCNKVGAARSQYGLGPTTKTWTKPS